jgi:hypothetical protein
MQFIPPDKEKIMPTKINENTFDPLQWAEELDHLSWKAFQSWKRNNIDQSSEDRSEFEKILNTPHLNSQAVSNHFKRLSY